MLSLAANGREMSFSSDTGMVECLVIARKREKTPSPLVGEGWGKGEAPAQRPMFVSLHRRPQGFPHASAIAKGIIGCNAARQIEDGPYDGASLMVGDGPGGTVGNLLTVRNDDSGANWGAVRLLDYALAQTAHALSDSRLWLPGQPAALDLKTVPLGVVGKPGLVDRDITGPPPRGPFTKTTPQPDRHVLCDLLGIRRRHLRRRPPPRRQMVRRAVSAWGEEAVQGNRFGILAVGFTRL